MPPGIRTAVIARPHRTGQKTVEELNREVQQLRDEFATHRHSDTSSQGLSSASVAGVDFEVPLTFNTGLTRTVNTINVNASQVITRLANLTSNGFVKTTGGVGDLTVLTPAAEITDELTTITHAAPVTPDYAVQDLISSAVGTAFGFATKDEGNTVLSVIANLQARVNALETILVNAGLLADAD